MQVGGWVKAMRGGRKLIFGRGGRRERRGRERVAAFIAFISLLMTGDSGAAGNRSSMVPSTGDLG